MAGDEAPTTEAACQDLVEILDEGSGRLDMGRYMDHVRDLSENAIATFEGTTRDHLDGRRVRNAVFQDAIDVGRFAKATYRQAQEELTARTNELTAVKAKLEAAKENISYCWWVRPSAPTRCM
ncbi:hypothetical protein ZWY2020_021463 [Hordeum vulgare]|nr:hypothetical protein ZWY2020_021463 [Hordeum vulgare]